MSDTPGSGVYRYDRQKVDPVSFQVIHHRLTSITDEQAATLSAVSGSPLVNEATDYNTGIFRAHGEIVTMGKTVLFHAASVAEMIKHIIADCEASPGFKPGDMFLVNHPYKGSLHAPDFGLVAPVFHEGRALRLDRGVLPSARCRRHGGRRLVPGSDRGDPGRLAGAAGQDRGKRRMAHRHPGDDRRHDPAAHHHESRFPRHARRQQGRDQALAGDDRSVRHRHRSLRHGRVDRHGRARRAVSSQGAAERHVPGADVPRPRRPEQQALSHPRRAEEAGRPADLRLLALGRSGAAIHELHAVGPGRGRARRDPADPRLRSAVERRRVPADGDRRARRLDRLGALPRAGQPRSARRHVAGRECRDRGAVAIDGDQRRAYRRGASRRRTAAPTSGACSATTSTASTSTASCST